MAGKTKKEALSKIQIRGARVHNLKNINVDIQRNKMTVITGLSGSGKSSLAFDTLYAEGQRRYVESLSSYARQFLGRMEKPDVDNIKGISPAIAIEQKVNTTNSRSTVGTSTEIYDYLKLLYARVGRTFSPISGDEVKRDIPQDVVDFLFSYEEGNRAIIVAPISIPEKRTVKEQLFILSQQGFSRVYLNDSIQNIDDLEGIDESEISAIPIVIDRINTTKSDENQARIAESASSAFTESSGYCNVIVFDKEGTKSKSFSNLFEKDGMSFTIPSTNFFTFNNPIGACPTCEGFGKVMGIDPDLVIPNKNLSVYEDTIVCWRGEKMSKWKKELILSSDKFDFPIHRPYHELTSDEKELLWTGNRYFEGLNGFFKHIESQSYKIQYRVMLSRYRGRTDCTDCKGTRLRKDAGYVKVGGASLLDVVQMDIKSCQEHFENLMLNKFDQQIGDRILLEIKSRLQFLNDVGLGYLSLNRLSSTLSGGESQRINLATSLGSSLVGSMYILDEPSIGLHPRDTQRLLKVLTALRDIGNSVIIVEHEEEVMQAADEIIDMGPLAGTHGGKVVFQGDHKALVGASESLTAKYLTGVEKIATPESRRKAGSFITVKGARENNLKSIETEIPLGVLTVITGVSGSGKSTLVKQVLLPSIQKILGISSGKTGEVDLVNFDQRWIEMVEFIDQNPIGKSSRSTPVTYVKAFDDIRTLLSKQQLSKINGYKPKHFSFNVEGGRCDLCEGEGQTTVSMQFMADVHLECESCKGKRFKDDVLEVKYHDKNIYHILTMTIDEAIEFFGSQKGTDEKKILEKIKPLQEVGLGYVQLGQSSNTLSGGEAQRIKLASFLIKKNAKKRTLFIFDEPTTGLHFHDIQKLLIALNALVDQGHSVIVIEHNTDIIKNADWIIDLGPEGGSGGGNILFEGTPEDLVNCKASYTGAFLEGKL